MSRGRKNDPTPESSSVHLDDDAAASAGAALTELARRSAEIAQRYDDGLPYDRNRMVNECKHYMGASAEAMLEAGKRLIVLKENEGHGEFTDLLENRLGLNKRTAQQMMQATVKYMTPTLQSKAQAPALLALGKAKLLDLLVEPDEAIEALVDGGTLAGLDLDDIQAMSSRELRAALAESRKKAAAKDAVIAKKDQKLNELTEAEERRRSGTASEREQQQLDDVREAGLAAEMAVRQLLATAGGVNDAPATEAAGTAARHAVEFVAQVLAGLISERGLAVDFQEMVTPHWLAGVAKHATGGKAK